MARSRRSLWFWTVVFAVPIALSALLPLWQRFFVGRNVIVRGRVMGVERVILRDATIACFAHLGEEWIAFEPQRTTGSGNYILRIPIEVFDGGAREIVVHAWSPGYGHARVVLPRVERSFGAETNDVVLADSAALAGTAGVGGIDIAFRRVADDAVPEIPFHAVTNADGSFTRPDLRPGDTYDVIAPDGYEVVEPARVTVNGVPVAIVLRPR